VKSVFLKSGNVVLFSEVIVILLVTAVYFIYPVLVDEKIVLTSTSNERKYSLHLRKGDVIRIQVKVDGDPVNLYVFFGNCSKPELIWEDVLSDNRHQYSGHRCSGCSPLCSDRSLCYEEVIVHDLTCIFHFKTNGDYAEVEVKIDIIDHVVVGIL